MGHHINEGFFTRKCMAILPCSLKKIGDLITKVAIRWGSTVMVCNITPSTVCSYRYLLSVTLHV